MLINKFWETGDRKITFFNTPAHTEPSLLLLKNELIRNINESIKSEFATLYTKRLNAGENNVENKLHNFIKSIQSSVLEIKQYINDNNNLNVKDEIKAIETVMNNSLNVNKIDIDKIRSECKLLTNKIETLNVTLKDVDFNKIYNKIETFIKYLNTIESNIKTEDAILKEIKSVYNLENLNSNVLKNIETTIEKSNKKDLNELKRLFLDSQVDVIKKELDKLFATLNNNIENKISSNYDVINKKIASEISPINKKLDLFQSKNVDDLKKLKSELITKLNANDKILKDINSIIKKDSNSDVVEKELHLIKKYIEVHLTENISKIVSDLLKNKFEETQQLIIMEATVNTNKLVETMKNDRATLKGHLLEVKQHLKRNTDSIIETLKEIKKSYEVNSLNVDSRINRFNDILGEMKEKLNSDPVGDFKTMLSDIEKIAKKVAPPAKILKKVEDNLSEMRDMFGEKLRQHTRDIEELRDIVATKRRKRDVV